MESQKEQKESRLHYGDLGVSGLSWRWSPITGVKVHDQGGDSACILVLLRSDCGQVIFSSVLKNGFTRLAHGLQLEHV